MLVQSLPCEARTRERLFGMHIRRSVTVADPGRNFTSKEAGQMLRSIRLPDAVNEAIILICLHTRLDAVKRESSQSGEDAGRAGRDLGPVAFDE